MTKLTLTNFRLPLTKLLRSRLEMKLSRKLTSNLNGSNIAKKSNNCSNKLCRRKLRKILSVSWSALRKNRSLLMLKCSMMLRMYLLNSSDL